MDDVIEHLTDDKIRRNLSMMMTVRRTARDLLFSKGFEEFDTPPYASNGRAL